MDFGHIFTRAWEIIWKHKVLWIFGILAGCGAQTQSTGFRSVGNLPSGGGGGPYNFPEEELPPELEKIFGPFLRLIEQNIQAIGVFILLMCVFAIIMIGVYFVLRTIGRIGLIQGTLNAEAGAAGMTFGEIWQDSMPFLGRALGLNLLVGLGIFGVFLFFACILIIPFVGLCLLCILVPIAWAFQIVIEQANVALVVEDLSVMEALSRGWNLASENIGNMVVIGIVLLIGATVAIILISLPIYAAFTPLIVAIITNGATGFEETIFRSLGVAILCIVAYTPVLMVGNGIIRSYLGSAWTLVYLQISGADLSDFEIEPPSVIEPA